MKLKKPILKCASDYPVFPQFNVTATNQQGMIGAFHCCFCIVVFIKVFVKVMSALTLYAFQ